MNTPLLERLAEHCHRLRLYQVEKELTARLEQAAKRELSYADFLDELLALEVGSKTEKHHQMRIAMARFPFHKTLESFDFKFQPSIDPKLIRELATGRYMHSGYDIGPLAVIALVRIIGRVAQRPQFSPHHRLRHHERMPPLRIDVPVDQG